MNANAEARSAVLGVAIGETEARGGGFGTDTVRAVCRFGIEMMNLHRIELHVTARHEAAVHVYEKAGFVFEARQRDWLYKHGRYYDRLTMGLLHSELRW
jgi:RimJ/RimL family protein N-acetyltransferase